MPDAISGSTITSTAVVSPVNDLMTGHKQVASPNPNGELGKDAFLKLLVAQLKYQDPSSPVDSSQFMAQTAAFTQVEKLDAMAKDSSANLALQQGLAASALVGRSVTYVDENGITQRGVVTSASFGGSGSGSAEPSVHIGASAVPLSSIVSVDDGAAPATTPSQGDASGDTDAASAAEAAARAAEDKAAEQKAMTDAISAALTQTFAGGVTGSIADAVAQAVAAALAAQAGPSTGPGDNTGTTTDPTTDITTTNTTTTTTQSDPSPSPATAGPTP